MTKRKKTKHAVLGRTTIGLRSSLGRPSPALVISLVALFVALGGTSYAAIKVGSKQIVNNSVRGTDIRNSTISDRDVKRNGLGGRSVKESSLGKVNSAGRADSAGNADRANTARSASSATTAGSANSAKSATTAGTATVASSVAASSVGAAGLQAGSVRASKVSLDGHIGDAVSVAAGGDVQYVTEDCDPGEQVISGGGYWAGDFAANPDLQIVDSTRSGNGWALHVRNNTGAARNFLAEVVCLNP